MVKSKKTEDDHIKVAKDLLLASILPNVEFDGWSLAAFEQAVIDSGVWLHIIQILITFHCPKIAFGHLRQ